MSVNCPVSLDRSRLRAEVLEIYGRVASKPDGEFHFHRGPQYAVDYLGYDPVELSYIPAENTAAFAGLGNPQIIGDIHPGETVLDIGCGGGTDLLLAARRTGSCGRAIGVDLTPNMIALARRGADSLGLSQVEIRQGQAESLPVDSESVDIVISNGALNLVPDKALAFSEIARVLKPGGRIYLADVLAEEDLGDEVRSDFELWAA